MTWQRVTNKDLNLKLFVLPNLHQTVNVAHNGVFSNPVAPVNGKGMLYLASSMS